MAAQNDRINQIKDRMKSLEKELEDLKNELVVLEREHVLVNKIDGVAHQFPIIVPSFLQCIADRMGYNEVETGEIVVTVSGIGTTWQRDNDIDNSSVDWDDDVWISKIEFGASFVNGLGEQNPILEYKNIGKWTKALGDSCDYMPCWDPNNPEDGIEPEELNPDAVCDYHTTDTKILKQRIYHIDGDKRTIIHYGALDAVVGEQKHFLPLLKDIEGIDYGDWDDPITVRGDYTINGILMQFRNE